MLLEVICEIHYLTLTNLLQASALLQAQVLGLGYQTLYPHERAGSGHKTSFEGGTCINKSMSESLLSYVQKLHHFYRTIKQ